MKRIWTYIVFGILIFGIVLTAGCLGDEDDDDEEEEKEETEPIEETFEVGTEDIIEVGDVFPLKDHILAGLDPSDFLFGLIRANGGCMLVRDAGVWLEDYTPAPLPRLVG